MTDKLSKKDAEEIRECVELLHAVETIQYHNKNWLPEFAKNPKTLSEEKLGLLERAKTVIGPSGRNKHT